MRDTAYIHTALPKLWEILHIARVHTALPKLWETLHTARVHTALPKLWEILHIAHVHTALPKLWEILHTAHVHAALPKLWEITKGADRTSHSFTKVQKLAASIVFKHFSSQYQYVVHHSIWNIQISILRTCSVKMLGLSNGGLEKHSA